jgi:hypothetical protein
MDAKGQPYSAKEHFIFGGTLFIELYRLLLINRQKLKNITK